MYTYPYYLILLFGLLLSSISCKDFEDCREVFTNVSYIELKSSTLSNLYIDKIEFEEPVKKVLYTQNSKDEKGQYVLNNLSRLPIPLHPKKTRVSLLFYKLPIDPIPDTLTIFYTTTPGILSPNCGLHQAYVLDSIATSFAEATILKPILRTKQYEQDNPEEVRNPNVKIRY